MGDVRAALGDRGMGPQNFRNGQKIRHKFRRGVTGEVRISGRTYQVKWSDGSDWENLHAGDVAL